MAAESAEPEGGAAGRRGAVARRKAKEAAVGAVARVLFYPTLLYNVVRSKVQAEFRWWDEVDQGKRLNQLAMIMHHIQFILLGAVPFRRDVPRLQKLGVCGVITLNEPFETLVPSSMYQSRGIEHLVIPTRDYRPVWLEASQVNACQATHPGPRHPKSNAWDACLAQAAFSSLQPNRPYMFAPSLVEISQAVDFIHRNVSCGRMTYIHCKAGRGRSTTIVLCYLVKYKNMTPTTAFEYVRSRRARVLLTRLQWRVVQEFSKRNAELPSVTSHSAAASPAGDAVLVTEADLEASDVTEII